LTGAAAPWESSPLGKASPNRALMTETLARGPPASPPFAAPSPQAARERVAFVVLDPPGITPEAPAAELFVSA